MLSGRTWRSCSARRVSLWCTTPHSNHLRPSLSPRTFRWTAFCLRSSQSVTRILPRSSGLRSWTVLQEPFAVFSTTGHHPPFAYGLTVELMHLKSFNRSLTATRIQRIGRSWWRVTSRARPGSSPGLRVSIALSVRSRSRRPFRMRWGVSVRDCRRGASNSRFAHRPGRPYPSNHIFTTYNSSPTHTSVRLGAGLLPPNLFWTKSEFELQI